MPLDQRITRRRVLAAIPAAPAVLRAARRPNILFILTDDQRQDTIAALGNPHIRTPNLDGLVRSGVTFQNAYCMGGFSPAVCLPSRMMIQRGRAWFGVRQQAPGYPCLPRSMKEAGYMTYHLGKRGNEDTASHKEYDHNLYLEPDDVAERDAALPGKQVADRSIGFLDRWKQEPGRKPFFMYLAGPAPHDPRLAPPEYLAKYHADKLPLPPNYMPFHPFDNGEMYVRDERLAPWPRTEAEIRRHLRDYYAVIEHMDAQIGRIFARLKTMGEYDNTVIAFTSDQGIAIGSHGLMGKQNLYEHSMRSGFTIAGPGIPKGKRSDAFAYLFDIYPTLCDFAGAPKPESLEGRSLAPIIRGKEAAGRDTVFLAYREFQRAVRRGEWKLIRYPQIDRTQLFNLRDDPYEMRDLSAGPEHKERIAGLLRMLAAQQKLFGDTLPLTSDNPKPGTVDLEFFRQAPPVQPNPKKKG
jgi:arylsulfatase A-like enzyme